MEWFKLHDISTSTNPFTAFAFEASGSGVNTSRTMPARISDIINVKDYGATGAGFPTDDWAAIMAAFSTTVSKAAGNNFAWKQQHLDISPEAYHASACRGHVCGLML